MRTGVYTYGTVTFDINIMKKKSRCEDTLSGCRSAVPLKNYFFNGYRTSFPGPLSVQNPMSSGCGKIFLRHKEFILFLADLYQDASGPDPALYKSGIKNIFFSWVKNIFPHPAGIRTDRQPLSPPVISSTQMFSL